MSAVVSSVRLWPGVLAMALVVVASNVGVQFLVGQWLTLGAFTYPLAFLVTDVFNRVYGPQAARRVVLAGFVVGVVCSLVGSQLEGESGPLVTLRIALGSGVAFLVAQLLDVAVFDRFRNGRWWTAPLLSTLLGSSLDTFIFFSVAFSSRLSFVEPANDVAWANELLPLLGVGPLVPLWVSLAGADWLVKLLLALLALLPFRWLVGRLQRTAHGAGASLSTSRCPRPASVPSARNASCLAPEAWGTFPDNGAPRRSAAPKNGF